MLFTADMIVITGDCQRFNRVNSERLPQNINHLPGHRTAIGIGEPPRPFLVMQIGLPGGGVAVGRQQAGASDRRTRQMM